MTIDRRTLMRTAAGMAAVSYSRVMGANDRVELGLIGSGRQERHFERRRPGGRI